MDFSSYYKGCMVLKKINSLLFTTMAAIVFIILLPIQLLAFPLAYLNEYFESSGYPFEDYLRKWMK